MTLNKLFLSNKNNNLVIIILSFRDLSLIINGRKLSVFTEIKRSFYIRKSSIRPLVHSGVACC